jgi:hypothetical protein
VPPEKNSEQSKSGEGHPPEDTPSIVREFRQLKGKYNRYRAAKKKERTEHQTNELLMARWTRRVGIFTIVLSIISAITAAILWKTDETLNRTLQLTQRPWIDVSAEIDGPLEWNKDGFIIPFKIVSKNTGYAPATNLFVTIRPISLKKQPFYAAEIIRENCDTLGALGTNSFGKVIFRDGISTQRIKSSVSNSEFDGEIVPPFVILCAAYAFSLVHEGAKTAILYQLFRSDPAHPGAGFTIERKDGNVSRENLQLFNFGSRAD